MSTDDVFVGQGDRASDFVFDKQVADVFDDMLARSVPFYHEQQNLIKEIASQFWMPGTPVVDLGCSLGTTLLNLAGEIHDAEELIGFDNSEPMLDRATAAIADQGEQRRVHVHLADLNGDLTDLAFSNASVVTLCWTLQFIRPLKRDRLVKHIYEHMADGGVLIVNEKILTNDSTMNRFFIDFYYNYKRKNGYSKKEIIKKRDALENVLIPYRLDENIELFRRNGFQIVETFFQWYNFAGFMCVKNV